MTSLRARLMLGLLALAAVGLVILDIVSYLELRSYLTQRVDQQVSAALDPVSHELVGPFFGAPPLRPRGSAPKHPRGAIPLPPPAVRGARGAGAPGGPPAGPPPEAQLPPGTAGVLLGRGDRVIKRLSLSYGEHRLPRPVLPARLPVSRSLAAPRIFTVAGSSGPGFRAAAVRPAGAAHTLLVAVPLAEAEQTLSQVRLIGVIVTAAVLAALAALAWWVIRVGLRPLERMTEAANAIAAGDLSRRVSATDERTEVGRLGAAFNAMIGRIEEAFARREASEERLRRFLADASHELRTPLSSIRGYAELFRLGAAEDPLASATAMRRIEDEAARMGTLVDDLLTLARLDEVPEPAREPVDLAAIAAGAAANARAAAPGRTITVDGAERAEVLGEPDQLRQVVANLLANAVAHTPPPAAIEVSVSAADREAAVRVRDHGPGLPPGAEAHVFERFWRDRSRPGSGDGGTGLGLAIVAAIAEAHGGRAEAANAEGGGALFTVALPLAGAGPQP